MRYLAEDVLLIISHQALELLAELKLRQNPTFPIESFVLLFSCFLLFGILRLQNTLHLPFRQALLLVSDIVAKLLEIYCFLAAF